MAETKRSKAELRQKVAEDLTLVSIGDAVPGELIAKIDAEIQNAIENLEDERLLIFDASAASNSLVIPARIFQALAELVAVNVTPSSGLGAPDEAVKASAMQRLRRSVLSGRDESPTEACYF